jgi:DNA-binding response OmpR family regulator
MGKRILVIEDDPGSRRCFDFLFEKEGYQVIVASNGLEGLRMARQDNPDILILDVMLPGLDGFEVCHRLRSEPATAKLPIIMLSAKGQDEDKVTALKVGANVFLAKPVDRQLLLNSVAGLLGEQREIN